jgi:hypothetical protein
MSEGISFEFIVREKDLFPYLDRKDALLVASPGRSGSTLLTKTSEKNAIGYVVLKSHILPPNDFQGKILFIFSNPDLAAESVLHFCLRDKRWGVHFHHLVTSDEEWFDKLNRDVTQQTPEYNLLGYDALGITVQLEKWLLDLTEPALEQHAEILAIKYENLWDLDVQRAIEKFLDVAEWPMPPKYQRGYKDTQLLPGEILCRQMYNKGTEKDPKYDAYDRAREIWENAPAFQFLRIRK